MKISAGYTYNALHSPVSTTIYFRRTDSPGDRAALSFLSL